MSEISGVSNCSHLLLSFEKRSLNKQNSLKVVAALVAVVALAVLITGLLVTTTAVCFPFISTAGAAFMIAGGAVFTGISLIIAIHSHRFKNSNQAENVRLNEQSSPDDDILRTAETRIQSALAEDKDYLDLKGLQLDDSTLKTLFSTKKVELLPVSPRLAIIIKCWG